MNNKKTILFSLKSQPLRELLIINKLTNQYGYKVDACVFTNRYFKEVNKLIKTHSIPINNLYDFTEFSRKLTRKKIDYYSALKTIEKELDYSLIDIIEADKGFFGLSFKDKLRRIYNLYIFFDHLNIQDYDISLQELSSSADLILYLLMLKYNKKPVSYWHGRFKNKVEFTNLKGEREGLKFIYLHLLEDKIFSADDEKLYNGLITDIKTPNYMKFATAHNPLQNLIKSKLFSPNYLRSYFIDKKHSIDANKTINNKVEKFENLFYKTRTGKSQEYYPCKEDNYVVFPEQYLPEASTMTFSPYFSNQIIVIETLRRNLPLSYPLVIKLHPSMDMNRKKRFLKRIDQLNHVYITRENNLRVISNATAIVTLTSTMGWEGILLDKKIFTLGNVFYNEFKYVHKLKDFSALREIKYLIEEWHKIISNEEYLLHKKSFVLAAYKSLKDGNMNSRKDSLIISKENISTLSKSIDNYIKQCL